MVSSRTALLVLVATLCALFQFALASSLRHHSSIDAFHHTRPRPTHFAHRRNNNNNRPQNNVDQPLTQDDDSSNNDVSSPRLYKANVSLTTLDDFLSFFTFENLTDPSGGVVTYTTREEAEQYNLYGPGSQGGIIIRADLTERNKTQGRKSVRLRGTQNFTDGVFVWNVASAPTGCGVWPALWLVKVDVMTELPKWPVGGELDMFEYGNGRSRRPFNDQSLHLNGTCIMPPQSQRNMTGMSTGHDDCDPLASKENFGCSVTNVNDLSTGPGFNANGGAWFVAERREGDIKTWIFPPCRVPWSLRQAAENAGKKNEKREDADAQAHTSRYVDTSTFGTPSGHWPSTPDCDLKTKFADIHPVANVDLCGTAQLYWRDDGCLAVAPDCYSWQATDDATDYYLRTGANLELDISAFMYFAPVEDTSSGQ